MDPAAEPALGAVRRRPGSSRSASVGTATKSTPVTSGSCVVMEGSLRSGPARLDQGAATVSSVDARARLCRKRQLTTVGHGVGPPPGDAAESARRLAIAHQSHGVFSAVTLVRAEARLTTGALLSP